MIVADPAITINTVAYAKPRFDAQKDFAPVGLFAMSPQVLCANPSFSPDIKQLLGMPKAQSEKVTLGTTGQGPYMTYEWLRTKTGLTLNEVPYKGAAPALTDVMAGQIALLMNPLAAVLTPTQGRQDQGTRNCDRRTTRSSAGNSDFPGVRCQRLRGDALVWSACAGRHAA
jgi:tripartite-type tricarboxylate transporter receptor subunit TctC